MNEDILYTPDEIAQKLKITKNTVYEMIKRGDLDAHRIGKHLRISNLQFETYLLKSKGYENSYEANLISENGKTIASIGPVNIHVNTEIKGRAKISIRPEDIILSKGTFISSARNIHKGVVTDIILDGNSAKVILDIGIQMLALITKESLTELTIEKGVELYAIFKTMSIKIYKL
ncbi:excisionase family DNA-binding protein [Clostridium sp.]|uniref:excisionase family DNA-binding protein n=1 Tax=Clostridium sp. TaxID=1506 RepID=UPI0026245585|nr:excisionase family DNA-binding protein [Clostridium sp.]